MIDPDLSLLICRSSARAIAARLRAKEPPNVPAEVYHLVEAFEELDGHLKNGGRLPRNWQKAHH